MEKPLLGPNKRIRAAFCASCVFFAYLRVWVSVPAFRMSTYTAILALAALGVPCEPR
eukprot:IDg19717t1